MGLKIIRYEDSLPLKDSACIRTDRRLWLTADKTNLVEDGDPRAATLFVGEGHLISLADLRRFGLVAPPPVAEEAAAAQPQIKKPGGKKPKEPAEVKGGAE